MEKKKVYYFVCIFAVALTYLALLISFVATKVTVDNNIYVTYVVSDSMVNPKDFGKKQVEEGYILSKPDSIPKASNKFFDGWYMDEGYTVEATFPIAITKSTTIYAKYIDGNVPADNIRYNDRDFTYYVTGTIDISGDTLVIPDAYNDGVHGTRSVGYIVGQDRESIINADSHITKVIVGNSISEICDYFLYNNTRITSVRLGNAVDSISGTAFGGCVNLTDINLGDFAEWRAGDESNPSTGGWYEELQLNSSLVITALSVQWQKKSDDVVITYKIGIIPDLSTNWKDNQTEVDAFNASEDNIYLASDYTNTDNKTTWNGSDFTITQRVKKNDTKLSTFNIYDEINMPYGNNTYFCGWYTYDATTNKYTEVCNGEANTNRTIAISSKITFYAKYQKGTIDPTTLDYATGGFTIARSNVTYINNNSISTVVIPDFYRFTDVSPAYEGLITTIGDFTGLGDLKHLVDQTAIEIYLGHNVTRIGNYAFSNNGFYEFTVGSYYNAWYNNVLAELGDYCFEETNCDIAQEFKIATKLTTIGQSIFYNPYISRIEIGYGIDDARYKSVVDGVDINGIVDTETGTLVVGIEYTNLKDMPASVTTIGENAFGYVYLHEVKTFEMSPYITTIEEDAFNMFGQEDKAIIFDLKNVQNIKAQAFVGSGIEKVIMPSNAITCESAVFTSTNISEVVVNNITAMVTSTYADAEANPMYMANGNITMGGSVITDIVVPAGITAIGSYSCAGFNTLNVTFEQNSSGTTDIVRIEEGAFNNCKNLTLQVTKTMNYIGANNFGGSSSLDLTCDQPESLAGWKCVNRAGSEQYIQYSLLDRAKKNMLQIIYISGVEWTKGNEPVVAYYSSFDHYLTSMPADHEYTGKELDTTTGTIYIDDYYYEGLFPSASTDSYVGGINKFDSRLDRYEPKSLMQSANSDKVYWICVSYLPGNVLIDETGITDDNGEIIAYATKPDITRQITDNYLAFPDKHLGLPVTKIDSDPRTNVSYSNYIPTNNTTIETVYIGNNVKIFYGYITGSFVKNIITNREATEFDAGGWFECTNLEKLYINYEGELTNRTGYACYIGKANGTRNGGFEVIIGNGVTNIPKYAFSYNSNSTGSIVSKVTFGNGSLLETIGYRAFYEGRQHTFTEISLPSSLIEIGEDAFYNCRSLINVIFEKDDNGNCKIENIGARAFGWTSNLIQITLPKSIKSLGVLAFNRCGNLESVTFEEGINITNLEARAFEECRNLSTINFANSMTTISERMFKYCNALTILNLPTSLKTIGDEAFYNCNQITTIVVPSGVTEIGKGAFNFTNSTYLTSLSFGDSSGWKYYTSSTDTSGIDAGFTGDPASDAVLMRSYYAGILRKN